MMPTNHQKLRRDREEVIVKFDELIKLSEMACGEFENSEDGTIRGDTFYRLRVSALNLLSRLSGTNSFYVEELRNMKPNAFAMKGLLQAARDDFVQGFMVDHDLLVSADIFSDMLVQSEILLENNYKDAAAVIVGAVLEDALRRLCIAREVGINDRDTIYPLNDKLSKAGIYGKVQHTEIQAKAALRNHAAHGHFDKYSKDDVISALEFTRRFIGQFLAS